MYMDRKTRIMEIISSSDKPVSASKIAKELGVSRQIIVGDVALLRASGEDITATPRGYILETNRSNHYTIAVKHNNDQLEEELKKQYPEAHIIRFDFDTTRNKNTHLKLLKDFEEHKADIMLGTQMIAKGLDFSNVTFVGVLMADLSLMVPDFRASERTFQLLCQVAGRSGRGEKQGTVMIQTFNPEHYAIKAAVKQDYDAFFKEEIAFRKKAKYPPYCHLVSVIVQSRSPKNVHSIALDISQYLRDHLEKVRIIGPQSTFKMQDIYRERILIKYIESKPIYEQLSIIDDYYNRTRKGGVIVACDFNPYSTY